MDFSPLNHIVKLCLQGMAMEENGQPEEALKLFLQGWNDATNDFERFLCAYYIARHQKVASDTLKWLETSLHFALKTNDDRVTSAFSLLHMNMAKCYEDLQDQDKARENIELSRLYKDNPSDNGPFYHGTKANLKVDDLLTPGGNSNYKSDLKMNHIYFTALANSAGLAAALAKGNGNERIYIVEPTGSFENDPNLTNKKFPGNPTRSYRSAMPLKVLGEVMEWNRQTPDELQKFRERVDNNKGEIIN